MKFRSTRDFTRPQSPPPEVPPSPAGVTATTADIQAYAWNVHLAEAAAVVYSDLPSAKMWLKANGCSEVIPFDQGFTQAVGYVKNGAGA